MPNTVNTVGDTAVPRNNKDDGVEHKPGPITTGIPPPGWLTFAGLRDNADLGNDLWTISTSEQF